MSQIGFESDALSLGAAGDECREVRCPTERNALPRIVRLESGIDAIVEVVGLADVEAVPAFVLTPYEHVDSRN